MGKRDLLSKHLVSRSSMLRLYVPLRPLLGMLDMASASFFISVAFKFSVPLIFQMHLRAKK